MPVGLRVMFLLSRMYFPAFLARRKRMERQNNSMQISPFKFFIVEEVMSSSLFAFKRLNLNSSEMGKVILFPLIQKFLKSFKFHSSFNHSNKQKINLIILLAFQNLGCYKPTTLKMNLVLEIRRG